MCLYHGDCRRILPQLDDADLLLTDPPYGIGVCKGGTISRRRKGSRRYRPVKWDNAPPPLWLMQMAMSKTRHQIIWGGGHIGLGRATCWLIWDKKNDGLDFSQAELAWTSLPRAVRVFRWLWSGFRQERPEARVHPTQKPVPLMEWCLAFDRQARTVIDPFAGSGSTLVACKRLGLRAVGIEQDLSYCQSARRHPPGRHRRTLSTPASPALCLTLLPPPNAPRRPADCPTFRRGPLKST